MKFCTYCGQEMRDENRFCSHCGKPFSAFVAVRQAAPPSHSTRNLALIVAAVGLSALILGALFFQILFPPAPINGIALTVRGNRTVGYTASFYLLDSNGKIVSTDGRVTFEIMDIGFNVLYKIVFSVSHNDFDVTNQSARFSPGIGFPNIPTSTGPGYLWKIPSSQVSPARVMSSDPNDGRAQIYFVTPTGQNLTLFQTGGLQV